MNISHNWILTVYDEEFCLNCGKEKDKVDQETCLGDFNIEDKVIADKVKELCREVYLKKGAGHVAYDDYAFALADAILELFELE